MTLDKRKEEYQEIEGQISEATEATMQIAPRVPEINHLNNAESLTGGSEDGEAAHDSPPNLSESQKDWDMLKGEEGSCCSEGAITPISCHSTNLQSLESLDGSELEPSLGQKALSEADNLYEDSAKVDQGLIRKLKATLAEKDRVISSLRKQVHNNRERERSNSLTESSSVNDDGVLLSEEKDGNYESDCSLSGLSMFSIWSADASMSGTQLRTGTDDDQKPEFSSNNEQSVSEGRVKNSLKTWVKDMESKEREVDSVVRRLRKLQLHRHQGIVSLCDHVAQQSSMILKLKNTLLSVLADNRQMKHRLKNSANASGTKDIDSECQSEEAVRNLCQPGQTFAPQSTCGVDRLRKEDYFNESQPYFVKGPRPSSASLHRRRQRYIDPSAPCFSYRDFGGQDIIRVLQTTIDGLTKDLCRSEEAKQAYQQQSLELSQQIDIMRQQLKEKEAVQSDSNSEIDEDGEGERTSESERLSDSLNSSCSYEGTKSFQPKDPALQTRVKPVSEGVSLR